MEENQYENFWKLGNKFALIMTSDICFWLISPFIVFIYLLN